MATIKEFKSSREQVSKGGKKTAKRIFLVIYVPGVDATISPQQAETDLANSAYAVEFGSAFPGEATLTCTSIDTKFTDVGIYEVTCGYGTFEDDPSAREINAEEIEVDFSTDTEQEYYGNATTPGDGTGYTTKLSGEQGQYGVPKLVVRMSIRVTRIQSTINYAAIATSMCHVNSGTYTTPGGTTLSTVVGDLLFVGCTTRQLDTGKYQLVYTFLRDLSQVNTGTASEGLKWRARIARFAEDTKLVESVNTYYIYPTSAFTGLMGDE